MAIEKLYPHGHDPKEQDRLDLQAKIHDRPHLTEHLAKARRVLDLGCGTGSNYELLKEANPDIHYVGVDISADAVAKAKTLFPGEDFRAMDATALTFDDGAFDFVFCNLVLWATGELSEKVCKEAHRVLTADGVFYSFEPDGKTLTFYPKKFAIQEILGKWERKMISLGLDPFVGRKVNSYLQYAGFSKIETNLYPKISIGSDKARYHNAAKNLAGVYLGPGPEFFDLSADDALWQNAQTQFETIQADDLILESYYVNIAVKG